MSVMMAEITNRLAPSGLLAGATRFPLGALFGSHDFLKAKGKTFEEIVAVTDPDILA